MGSAVGPGTQTYLSSEQQAEMTKFWSKMAFGLALISIAFIAIASTQPYDEEYGFGDGDIDYMDNSLRDLIHETPKKRFYFTKIYDKRRICIPPQMSCLCNLGLSCISYQRLWFTLPGSSVGKLGHPK